MWTPEAPPDGCRSASALRSPSQSTGTSLRGAARRGNLRDPGSSSTESALSVLTGPGRKSGWPGSRRLPRRWVISGPVLGCFEPMTRFASRRSPSHATPLRDTGGGYQKNAHGPCHIAKMSNHLSWIRTEQSRFVAGGGPRSGCWGLAMTCSLAWWWEQELKEIVTVPGRFEPMTRFVSPRFAADVTPRNDLLFGWVVGTEAEGARYATARSSARGHPSYSVIPQLCGDPESEHQGPAHFPVDRNVIARSGATRQSTRTGLLVHRDGPGRTLRSWAENRAVWRTDRGPGRTRRFCARSSLRIANAEALFFPFPVPFHRHVIARSGATRQSTRTGPPGVRLVALGVPSASVPTVPRGFPTPKSSPSGLSGI